MPYRKVKKAGTIEDLKLKAWRAVVAAEEVTQKAMKTPEDTDRCKSAIYTYTLAMNTFNKIAVADDQEQRIKALEEAANSSNVR